LKIESVTRLDWIGSDDELLNAALRMPTDVDRPNSRRIAKQQLKAALTLQKLADRMYLTLSDSMVFNLSFEPATQYNLCRFIDKGEDDLTCDKLRRQVLYLETKTTRYEVARFLTEDFNQKFRIAIVKDPSLKTSAFLKKSEIPLPLD
jgi:hypothetical protein